MAGLYLLNSAAVSQAAAVLVTDPADWEAMVSDIELFTTISENIALADELASQPGMNAQLGPILTFQSTKTGLSRGFFVETLQEGAGFTFNESEGGVTQISFQDALSVGDINGWEDDDWQLSLLDGASMMAFAVEIRSARFGPGEAMTLYSGSEPVGSVDLNSLPNIGDENYFIGLISDVPFDRVSFDEDPDGDDIGIADFRFANVLPSEIEAVVDIKPDTINLKSRGRYVTAYIELPEGYSVEEIDRSTVVISGIEGDIIDPALHTVGPWQIGDYDQDGNADLMVKFDRQELIPLLKVTDKTITVSGELTDGTQFTGMDKSRIIKPKKKICFSRKYGHLFKKWNVR
ncbi:MAG: hypothetical protein C4581_06025 [Nitrospiraceae bacterium]|nr:MAG: hypothetical protein C4581_06025 [Nitrospiraceae bacterium]